MTYQEKMLHHLKRAEELHEELDRLEAGILKQIDRRDGAQLSKYPTREGRENMKLFLVEKEIQKGFERLYRNRAKNRDMHMNWAQLYGTAALLEKANE